MERTGNRRFLTSVPNVVTFVAMDFKEWFLQLSEQERARYATDAGTTPGYIRVHLIGRRKIPRPELLRALSDASLGRFTVPELLAFFYGTGEPQSDSSKPVAHESRL